MPHLIYRHTNCTKCCWCGVDMAEGLHACTGEEPNAVKCKKEDCPDSPFKAKEMTQKWSTEATN